MKYSHDGKIYGPKQDNSEFKLHFNSLNLNKNISYKDALYRNASLMRDEISGPFDLCLSGGIDSEVVTRIYKDLGIKHNTFIFELENDINRRDVNDAVNICKELDLKYKIIKFNLKKFMENDAEYYAGIIKSSVSTRLPRLKWIELLDNTAIFCEGEPYWRRKSTDWSKKSKWVYLITEDMYSNSIYSSMINKPCIGQWYEYTPEVLWSNYKLSITQNLIKDKIPGKLSSWSSRYDIHKEFWPSMIRKPKLTGFDSNNPGSKPEYMTEFENTVLSKYSNKFIILTEKEFKACLTSPQEF